MNSVVVLRYHADFIVPFVFNEVPPFNLRRDTSFGNDRRGKFAMGVLLGVQVGGGNLVTPVLDQCIGTGKTSLQDQHTATEEPRQASRK